MRDAANARIRNRNDQGNRRPNEEYAGDEEGSDAANKGSNDSEEEKTDAQKGPVKGQIKGIFSSAKPK
jgi:hypothetical protein